MRHECHHSLDWQLGASYIELPQKDRSSGGLRFRLKKIEQCRQRHRVALFPTVILEEGSLDVDSAPTARTTFFATAPRSPFIDTCIELVGKSTQELAPRGIAPASAQSPGASWYGVGVRVYCSVIMQPLSKKPA